MAAAIYLSGCSKNTPRGVVENYYSALQSQKYDEAAQCFSSYENSGNDDAQELVSAFSGKLKESLEEKEGLKSYKITGDSICNDSVAYVFSQYELGNGEAADTKIRVVKEGEDWKIDPMSK